MKNLFTLIALLFLVACPSEQEGASENAGAEGYSSPVRLAQVEVRDVRRTLQLGAVAQAWQSARLAPASPGRVDRVAVELGQEVSRGELLVAMDRRLVELQRQQARRSLELAELQQTDANRELARAEGLAASGAITPQNLQKAQLGAEVAQAQKSQAEAALELLAEQLSRTRIIAPFDGAITGIFAEPGELYSGMAGLGGAPAVVSMASLDPIRLDLLIPERDLGRISIGMNAVVLAEAYPEAEFEGAIVTLNAAAEPGSRRFRAQLEVPNPDRLLRPGMFLRAMIVLEHADGVAAVQREAIVTYEDAPAVFVVSDDVATRRPVQLGLSGDSTVEVTGGLVAGESVVVEGSFGLPDGARVRVLQ